jgi:hypothetical protein
MAASQEILAAGSSVAGVPMAYILATGGLIGAGATMKKLTPSWHHTINEGERGVWLHRGKPVLLDGFTQQDVENREKLNPFDLTAHYKIGGPKWYFVGPFRTLQTVDIADQPSLVTFDVESADEIRSKMAVRANLTWNVIAEGDNPVRSITRVKHIKRDKKDADARDPERQEHTKSHPLEERVLQIGSVGLGRVLSGKMAKELYQLTYLDKELGEEQPMAGEDIERYKKIRDAIREQTIKECAGDLIYYGVCLSKADLLPVTRVNVEVQAQALRTLGVLDAAVAGAVTGPDVTHEENRDNVSPLHGVPQQQVAEA